MSTTITSNLYPPIMLDVIPGFINTSSCKVYFAISKYNSIDDISNVQITLTNVKTNESVLNSSLYPTGIKLTNLYYDSQINNDYCYYVIINPTDLASGFFELNKYYKIQMRFTSTLADDIDLEGEQAIASWLNDNQDFFSEWSKTGLLRGISQPTMTIDHLINDNFVTLQAPIAKISGQLTFLDPEEQDYLEEYNVKVYSNQKIKDESSLIFNSGILYPEQNKKNIVDCNLACNFENNKSYTIVLDYTTHFLYNQKLSYYIAIESETIDNPYQITITSKQNNQDGYINIQITMDSTQQFSQKKILLRRSCSKDNFQTLQTLFEFDSIFPLFVWPDISVENGIWYKYSVYIIDLNGALLYYPIETDPTLCYFEDIFLVNNNIQFRLQFNPSITGFKYNVSESQQVTLGSKFPYIKRNGDSYYRSFSIGGLISSLTDESSWYDSYLNTSQDENLHIGFSSKRDLYSKSYDLYSEYESENNISNYLNPFYERLFREAVYDFLYSEKPKLFRSPTEGNILVSLTNISFQPVATLGRVLYSFTATATQIDQATFDNYKKYDVILDSGFKLVTESPALEIKQDPLTMVLVINANGASQNADQNWALHLQSRMERGGKIV